MTRFRVTVPKMHSVHVVLLALASVAMLAPMGCKKSDHSSAVSGPKTFASPDEASSAVYTAAKSGDGQALIAIFGPDATDLIISGDPVQDKAGRDKFAAQYDEMHRWGKLTNGGKVLTIGAENYPFPFSLMKNSSGQWYFDTTSAKEEILARRIGGNELATVDVLNAMSDAQIEYFQRRNMTVVPFINLRKNSSATIASTMVFTGRPPMNNRRVPLDLLRLKRARTATEAARNLHPSPFTDIFIA